MKKLVKILAVLVVLLVIVVVVAISYVDRIARSGIETATTSMLGVQTKIDSLHIRLLAAEGNLGGLEISNPQGFSSSHFLTLKNGELGVSLGSLTSDTVEVPRILLEGITVNLEKSEGKANYDVILANMKKGESTSAAGTGKNYIVRELVIKDLMVHVEVLPLIGKATRVDVPIDEIRLTNIGTGADASNGVQMKELSGTIVKAVFAAIAKSGGGLIPADITKGLGEGLAGLKDVGDVGVKLAGETMKQVGKAAEDVTKAAEDVTKGVGDVGKSIEGIGDIFKKK